MPDDDHRERTYQLWGWILFVLCAFLFIASSIRGADILSLSASIVFLIACAIFMIPLAKAMQTDRNTELPGRETGESHMTDTMQFLYVIRPTRQEMLENGPTPEEAEIVSQHFSFLEELTEQGVVVLAGRTLNTDATSFGIVIFNAASEETAFEVMNGDPAVRQGVMQAELYPYRIALMAQHASSTNLEPHRMKPDR
jgi:uncharacterized protein YciI